MTVGIGVTEHAFVTMFALLMWLAFRLFEAPSLRRAIGFGALAVALYAVHERALLVIGVASLQLLVLAGLRRVRVRDAVAAVATMVAGLVGVRALVAHVADTVYHGAAISRPLSLVLRKFLSPYGWIDLALQSVGQAWYLLLATGGLFALGVGVLLWTLWEKRREWARAQTLVLLFASAGAIFGSCAIYFPSNAIMPLKAEYMYFGRINEGFLPIFLAAGFVVLSVRRLALAGVVAVALGAVMVWGRGMEALGDEPSLWGVFGTWWLVGDESWLIHPALGTALVCGVTTGLAWATRRRAEWMAVAVAVPFLWVSVALSPHYLRRRLQREYARDLTPVAAAAGIERIAVGTDSVRTGRYAELVRRVAVTYFHADAQDAPHAVVLTQGNLEKAGARFLASERDRDYALWVLPGPEMDRLYQPPDPRTVVYGAAPVWTVAERGFRDRDPWREGQAMRWTSGRARLTIPLGEMRPAAIGLDIAAVADPGGEVTIEVDGEEVARREVGAEGWRTVVPLAAAQDPLRVTIRSERVRRKRIFLGEPRSERRGVLVRAVSLLDASEVAVLRDPPAGARAYALSVEGTGPLTVEARNTGETAWVDARIVCERDGEARAFEVPRVVMPGRTLRFVLSPPPGRWAMRVDDAEGTPVQTSVSAPRTDFVPLRFLARLGEVPAPRLTLLPAGWRLR